MQILTISDLHGNLPIAPKEEFDLLLIAGDVCPNQNWSAPDEWIFQQKWVIASLLPWLQSINAKHKLIIPGNHDMMSISQWIYLLEGVATFAHDKTIRIDDEVIYSNGYSFNSFDIDYWGYGYRDKLIHPFVHKIPDETTILMTHEPAYGIGDLYWGESLGSPVLVDKVNQLTELKLHVWGHVHEGAGIYQHHNNAIAINTACTWHQVSL